VDQLPRTARDIQLLLLETPHRLSREVQYSILNCLDYSTIVLDSIELLLPSATELLNNVSPETSYVWMKLGCCLGDGWLLAADSEMRREISHTLLNAVRTARFVYGRKGALHGIEHALNSASLREGKKLLEAVQQVALSDRSISVRRSAYLNFAQWPLVGERRVGPTTCIRGEAWKIFEVSSACRETSDVGSSQNLAWGALACFRWLGSGASISDPSFAWLPGQ
jgi:hypothetical protein